MLSCDIYVFAYLIELTLILTKSILEFILLLKWLVKMCRNKELLQVSCSLQMLIFKKVIGQNMKSFIRNILLVFNSAPVLQFVNLFKSSVTFV